MISRVIVKEFRDLDKLNKFLGTIHPNQYLDTKISGKKYLVVYVHLPDDNRD